MSRATALNTADIYAKLTDGTHILMPIKPDGRYMQAIEDYFAKTVNYRDRQNCDALKADCWKALMAYYAMVELAKSE